MGFDGALGDVAVFPTVKYFAHFVAAFLAEAANGEQVVDTLEWSV